MSTLSYAVSDSLTMLRRNLKHSLRYPMIFYIAGTPIVLLLLFQYVFGGTLGAGLGSAPGSGLAAGHGGYVNYLAPGIILLTVMGAPAGAAISVAMDMTEGIIARFRTMAISRSSVLNGHVLGNMIQTLGAVVIVTGVALLTGFRPTAGPLAWLAVVGLLVLLTFAVNWLAVALGLFAKGVESASNYPMILMLLPFLGSGFVPTQSMPAGLRWFAEHQPFTPINETLRGLLLGTPIGDKGIIAIAWCAGIAALGYLWAKRLYRNRLIR